MVEEVGYSKIVKRNIENTITEGNINAIKVGVGESYFDAFAIKVINATPFQLGLLSSIPMLLGYISNIFSHKAVEKLKSRKSLILFCILINSLCFFPIFLSVFIKGYEFLFLLLSITLYFISELFLVPAWVSLMGDIIPDQIKGLYFGERNKSMKFFAFASMLMGGFILQTLSGFSLLAAFGIIFFIAFLARLASFYIFTKIYEPEYVFDKSYKFSFLEFIKNLKNTNFGIFVIFMCIFTISYRIAAPYFSLYIFRYLEFDYMKYTIITASSALATILSMPIWGRYVDEYGNKKVMTVTAFCIPFIPLLWMLSSNFLYLILVELFSGFVWAGFNLSSFNFIFFSTSSEKRSLVQSYYNVLLGISLFVGSIIGGLLIEKAKMFEIPVFNVFIISAIFRFLSVIFLIHKIKEPLKKKEISYSKLLFTASFVEIWKSLQNINIVKWKRRKKSIFEKLVEVMEKDAGGRI
ncbi:MAG: MFS transporter [Candidatus Aenigmarchaeota archaeon]|nr:MFS transporter [Candidatus Aenigmarchaeota archaeon]